MYLTHMLNVSPSLTRRTRIAVTGNINRLLTVDETKLLQGFPEAFDLSSVSRSTALVLLGNAMTVPVMAQLIRCVLRSLGR